MSIVSFRYFFFVFLKWTYTTSMIPVVDCRCCCFQTDRFSFLIRYYQLGEWEKKNISSSSNVLEIEHFIHGIFYTHTYTHTVTLTVDGHLFWSIFSIGDYFFSPIFLPVLAVSSLQTKQKKEENPPSSSILVVFVCISFVVVVFSDSPKKQQQQQGRFVHLLHSTEKK